MSLDLKEALLSSILVLLGIALRWLASKFKLAQAKADAASALLKGVAFAKQTYIDELKKANADGIITEDEEKKARKIALDAALTVAPEAAQAIIKAWTEDEARVHLEAAVVESKK